jgi:uncharacterized protein (DUF427 family)
MKAVWKGTVVAEGSDTVVVEGNHYFRPEDVKRANIKASSHTSVCPWKGTAGYYDVVVGADVNANAAWYYAEPKKEAEKIRGRIAFWRGVEVVK